jgi:hypothetical protein
MTSNLKFVTHEPPIQTDSNVFGVDYQVMTVTWKDLPFLYVWYTEDTPRGISLRLTQEDEDDDEDDDEGGDEPLSGVTPKEYVLTSLIPELKSCWGQSTSLTKIKELAFQAEKELVQFARSIQMRPSFKRTPIKA